MNQITDPESIRNIIERQRDADAKREMLIADTIAAHPKRRGELRAEYTRRVLRLVREVS